MQLSRQLISIQWVKFIFFYGIILAGTFLARKLPNLLQWLLGLVTDISFSFNYNHGLVTLTAALLFYKYSKVKQQATLLGSNPLKSLLFPLVLLSCYSFYGISNHHGVDRHLWALLTCCFALVYNIMEEYAWRGYLADSMGKAGFVLKSILSGSCWACWHLLVFRNFDQYGGFAIFFAFCIVFSFILTFAVARTRSILVAATIHAFIIQTNIAALICIAAFALLLLAGTRKRVMN